MTNFLEFAASNKSIHVTRYKKYYQLIFSCLEGLLPGVDTSVVEILSTPVDIQSILAMKFGGRYVQVTPVKNTPIDASDRM